MKTLLNTNPYLNNTEVRKYFVNRSVRTSCGVEGIYAKIEKSYIINIPSRGPKKIYKNLSK